MCSTVNQAQLNRIHKFSVHTIWTPELYFKRPALSASEQSNSAKYIGAIFPETEQSLLAISS